MQRIIAGVLLIPTLALLSGLAGCGKEEKPKPPVTLPKVGTGDGGGKVAGGAKKSIEPGKATIVGRVVYKGDAPMPASLKAVMGEHKDKQYCLAGTANELIDQTWLINKDKGVENAVIWLNPPANSEFKVVEDKTDAVLDQPHCVYVPHVVAIKPGEKLLIKNSAPMVHNTKLDVDALVNRPFGQAIPPKGTATVDLKPQDRPINVACDFHGWMKAKIWVLPHQYVAVTKEDGTFKIDNVPEGVELSIVTWHEGVGATGYVNGKKGVPYTTKAGENKLPDTEVSAK